MHRFNKLFLITTGSILVLTAIAKSIGLLQGARILYATNGLVGLDNRFVYGGAAVAELAVAAFLLFGKNSVTKAFSVVWLASCFGAYRLGNWWLDIPEPCSCLGQVSDWIPGLSPYADSIALGLLAYFMTGSLAIILHDFRRRTESTAATLSKSKGSLATLGLGTFIFLNHANAADGNTGTNLGPAVTADRFVEFLQVGPAIDTLIVRRTLHTKPVFFDGRKEADRFMKRLKAGEVESEKLGSGPSELSALRHLPNREFIYHEISSPDEAWALEVRDKALLGRDSKNWWRFHSKGLETTDAPDGIYLEHTGREQTYYQTMYQRATEPIRLGFYDVDLSSLSLSSSPLPQSGEAGFTATSLPEYGSKPIEGVVTTDAGLVSRIQYSLLKAPVQKVQGRVIELTHRSGQLQRVTIANRYNGSSSTTPYADYQFLSWKITKRPTPEGFCSAKQFMKESDSWFLRKANGEIFNMKLDPTTPSKIMGATGEQKWIREPLHYFSGLILTIGVAYGLFLRREKRIVRKHRKPNSRAVAAISIILTLIFTHSGRSGEITPQPVLGTAVTADEFVEFLQVGPAIDTLIVRRTLHTKPVFFDSQKEADRFMKRLKAGEVDLGKLGSGPSELSALRHLPNREFIYHEISSPDEAWALEVRDKALLGRDSKNWWSFHRQGLETTDAPDGVYLEHNGKDQFYYPTMYQRATEPIRLGLYDIDLTSLQLVDSIIPKEGEANFTATSLPEYGSKPIEGSVKTESGLVTRIKYSLLEAPAQKVQGRLIELIHYQGHLKRVTVENRYKESSSSTPYAVYEFLDWKLSEKPYPEGFCSAHQFMKASDNWFETKATGEVFNMKFDPSTPARVMNPVGNRKWKRQFLLYGSWTILTAIFAFGLLSRRNRHSSPNQSVRTP